MPSNPEIFAGANVLVTGGLGFIGSALGRRLVEREPSLKIHGEKIAVKAQVHTLGGFSAHAGQTDLLSWFNTVAPSRPRIVVVHGEDTQRAALAKKLKQRFGLTPKLPTIGETIEL